MMHEELCNDMYGGVYTLLWVADTKSRYPYLNDYEHDPKCHSNSLTHCLQHTHDIQASVSHVPWQPALRVHQACVPIQRIV